MLFAPLIRPWAYLSIKPWNKQKITIDLVLPLLLSIICVVAVWYWSSFSSVFGSGKLIEKITGFIQTLPGFYLAALSAIATFNNPGMDQYLQGEPLKIKVVLNGAFETITLTRRRFLPTMFAYLTVQSFIASMIGMVLISFDMTSLSKYYLAVAFFCFIYIIWQLLIITLWGIYYLGERIHTPN